MGSLAREFRRQTQGQLPARALAQRVEALEKGAQDVPVPRLAAGQLLGGEGDVGGSPALDALVLVARRFLQPFANDDGARGHVAQPLAALGDEHQEAVDQIKQRDEIANGQQVPDSRGREIDRGAARADHANAGELLARRLAVVADFEINLVPHRKNEVNGH